MLSKNVRTNAHEHKHGKTLLIFRLVASRYKQNTLVNTLIINVSFLIMVL